MVRSPYRDRPPKTFWRSVVANPGTAIPPDLYERKWPIAPQARIATAGSCFAQHIGRHLKQHAFKLIDTEPAPLGLSPKDQQRFGYATYSARYGNIYTTRQLLQLAQEALGQGAPADAAWQREGAWFDAMRPGVEPDGLASAQEVATHRAHHLAKVRQVLEAVDVMVFTLGLTEAWLHAPSGTVYPTAPGTIAGSYEPEVHQFVNFGFQAVVDDFLAFRALVQGLRKGSCRFLLTVSPVPLAATATDRHVMSATVYSKSVLRAAAGHLADTCDDIDYFPSYEIVTNPWSSIPAFERDLRSVRPEMVAAVMDVFLRAHLGDGYVPAAPAMHAVPDMPDLPAAQRNFADDVVCEEAILDAFGAPGR